jgi:hypothetical protein
VVVKRLFRNLTASADAVLNSFNYLQRVITQHRADFIKKQRGFISCGAADFAPRAGLNSDLSLNHRLK